MKIIELLQILNSGIFLLFAGGLILNIHLTPQEKALCLSPDGKQSMMTNLMKFEDHLQLGMNMAERTQNSSLMNLTTNDKAHQPNPSKMSKPREDQKGHSKKDSEKIIFSLFFTIFFFGLGAIYKLGIISKMQTF